jgi:predicted DNA-binding transcriptional regulator YafY
VDDGPRDVYERVRIAIATKRMLRCGYDSVASQGRPDAPAGPFDLHPYALWYCQRAWYVVGRHGRHRAVRLLKLNRFTAIDLTDRLYAIPDDFRLSDHTTRLTEIVASDSLDLMTRHKPRRR